MRVLHLVKTSDGAKWAYRLMRELVTYGIQVHVALPPHGQLVEAYRDAGVTVHLVDLDIPSTRPWRVIPAVRRFRRLVCAVRPDIVHSHFVSTTLVMRWGLGSSGGVKRVFQVPGPLHLESRFFSSLEVGSARGVDYWIPTCEWTRERYLALGVPPSSLFPSRYGLDLGDYSDSRSGVLRDMLGVGPDTKLVGMVAFMYPPKWYVGQKRGVKGHEDLIDAMAVVRGTQPDAVAVIVGGGGWKGMTPYERHLRTYAQARCPDGVRFLGTRRDVLSLYPDFDVAVHPSHSENLGGAPESQLSGVPTIATAVGGFPDIVEHGVTGWLVPPRDPTALATAISTVLGLGPEARAVAEQGKARARAFVDVKHTATDVLHAYQRILGDVGDDGRGKLA